jgi:ferrochelatase
VTTEKNKTQLAVILINLGTPATPTVPAIRRYLAEFLSDPRVVNLPRLVWLPILYLVILTLRPGKLVHKYKLIWGTHDGPIRNITRALAARTERMAKFEYPEADISVEAAMTYGEPSVKSVMAGLRKKGISDFLFLPLYPQYSIATTAAAHDVVHRALSTATDSNLGFVSDYHEQPLYIEALASSIQAYSQYLKSGAMLVFSFHGIPQAQADNGDPYPAHCARTASLVASHLGLKDNEWMLTFQSRFGPSAWLMPYTSEVMADLPKQGTNEVLVVCPGFATDCLETIEEIKILNRDLFLGAGGKRFRYVKALNATHNHARVVASIIDEYLFQNDAEPTTQNGI